VSIGPIRCRAIRTIREHDLARVESAPALMALRAFWPCLWALWARWVGIAARHARPRRPSAHSVEPVPSAVRLPGRPQPFARAERILRPSSEAPVDYPARRQFPWDLTPF